MPPPGPAAAPCTRSAADGGQPVPHAEQGLPVPFFSPAYPSFLLLQLMEASQYRMLNKAEWDAAMAEDFLVRCGGGAVQWGRGCCWCRGR